MAALFRGLRAGAALRGLSCVVLPTVSRGGPQRSGLRRGFHCAALRRLQEDPKSDKDPVSSSSTTTTTSTPSSHQHYQASSSDQDTSTSSTPSAEQDTTTTTFSSTSAEQDTDTTLTSAAPTSEQETITTTSSSTPSAHQHYQAVVSSEEDDTTTTTTSSSSSTPSSEPDTTTDAAAAAPPPPEEEPPAPASTSAQQASASDTVAEEAPQPDTSYAEQEQQEEEEEEYETEEQLQARLLTAALDFVPVHGWSMEAISAGAEAIGLSTASSGMFPNGAGDLVLHFISQSNAQLTQILAEQHTQVQLGHAEPKKTADFLRDAVETRLRMLIPYIDTWPQAMSILLLPHNIPDSLKHLSTLVDDMWYYAGDRSTDLNWYTKRAALTGIYNTTELVMLQDSSPDFQDTWTFLDNRIQDIVNMATTAKQVKSTGEAVVQGLMGAAITLKNLAGVNQRR